MRRSICCQEKVSADHSLYSWNTQAAKELSSWGNQYRTLSVELNRKELEASADLTSELIVYGGASNDGVCTVYL